MVDIIFDMVVLPFFNIVGIAGTTFIILLSVELIPCKISIEKLVFIYLFMT